MKLKGLSISNISWTVEQDVQVYTLMQKYGFTGLEIAPTRIFPEAPYDKLKEAEEWAKKLYDKYGFTIPSMQSIWFGRSEKLFGTDEERKSLVSYTKKAVDFAAAIDCRNLVFGCPRNRNIPAEADEQIAIEFFKEIGDYAASKDTVIGMEANPPIYNTNYINDTLAALELIYKVDSKGFRLNLDLGTIIQNEEQIDELTGKVSLINHVHISEPGLKPVQERMLHQDLIRLLRKENYQGFLSIEMGKQEDVSIIEDTLKYIEGVYNG